MKGENIEFVLTYTGDTDDFTVSESNFEPLNALNLHFQGNNLKDALVSISAYLITLDASDRVLLKIATGSETILKLT